MRYHFTPIRMAAIKKNTQKITSVGNDVEKLEPLCIAAGNAAATMENSMAVPKKIKNRITIWFINPIYEYISTRIGSRVSVRYLHAYVHSSIIQKSQKVEATQVSTDRQTDKQNVA